MISNVFSDHNSMKTEIKYRKNNAKKKKKKTTKYLETKQHTTKQPMSLEELTEEVLKNTQRQMKWKHKVTKSMGHSKSSS